MTHGGHRLAVLRLDLLDKPPQRGLVGGVACHDFVGERQPLGRDDQRDHHLHAVGALVAAVAKLANAFLLWRIALEVGAREVIQNSDILPVGTMTR